MIKPQSVSNLAQINIKTPPQILFHFSSKNWYIIQSTAEQKWTVREKPKLSHTKNQQRRHFYRKHPQERETMETFLHFLKKISLISLSLFKLFVRHWNEKDKTIILFSLSYRSTKSWKIIVRMQKEGEKVLGFFSHSFQQKKPEFIYFFLQYTRRCKSSIPIKR